MNVLKSIRNYDVKDITKIIMENDFKEYMPDIINIDELDENKLHDALVRYLDYGAIKEYAVLGIDIYKYSVMNPVTQSLIPYTFHALIGETITWLIKQDKRMEILFSEFKEESDFLDSYIDTGDGGFFIFENPLLALAFAMTFAFWLRIFNTYHFLPKYRKMLKENITVRYSITMGKIYKIDNKYYGDAIITNNRIMSRDHLNRCLIDEKTHDWFLKYLNGIDNLRNISISHYLKIPYFNEVIPKEIKEDILQQANQKNTGDRFIPLSKPVSKILSILTKEYIHTVDVLKIDELKTKDRNINIHNLHIQFSSYLRVGDNPEGQYFCISFGNLNTQGLK